MSSQRTLQQVHCFFPEGKSAFAGPVDDMLLNVRDTTQTVIVEFLGDGTIE